MPFPVEICLLIWGALMVLFIILELSSCAMVSIWFVFGALAAIVAAWQGCSFLTQTVVFVGVSALLLMFTWPMVRALRIRKIPTNSDEIIGAEGIVQSAIDNVKGEGRVVVDSIDWAAKSTNGRPIPADSVVTVDKLEGVTLYVTRQWREGEHVNG